MTDGQVADAHITCIADAVVRLKEIRDSQKNLNEPDIEDQFAKLSLSFKTDKFTLSKRVELQQHQRDNAERNIERELESLRESLNALNQLCTGSDMRDVITKTQQHVDIVQETTKRMSREAETYGAVQQEQRLHTAFETTLSYAEHLKMMFDKEHIELEEYRRLLAENNLLPEEKRLIDDDSKRILPPRSHSLSSSSKPEPRGRLLSAVCLLSPTSSDSSWAHNGNVASSNPSLSPKSRRASLPVGPVSTAVQTSLNVNALSPIPSKHFLDTSKSAREETSRKESLSGSTSTPKVESSHTAEKSEECVQDLSQEGSAMSPVPEEDVGDKDCRKRHLLRRGSSDDRFLPQFLYTLQNHYQTDLDHELSLSHECEELNDTTIKTSCLSFLRPFLSRSGKRMWHWNSAALLQWFRYLMSVILAIAAVFSFLLTFLPNSVIVAFLSA